MCNLNFDFCRRSSPCVGIWISHLHQRGTLMVSLLLLETRTKPAGFGMSEIYPSQLLFWRATLEPFDQSAILPMVSIWQWQSLLTSCMSMMWKMDTRRNRRLISLARYLVYHSVRTPSLFLLECGIIHMVASLSMADAGTIIPWCPRPVKKGTSKRTQQADFIAMTSV